MFQSYSHSHKILLTLIITIISANGSLGLAVTGKIKLKSHNILTVTSLDDLRSGKVVERSSDTLLISWPSSRPIESNQKFIITNKYHTKLLANARIEKVIRKSRSLTLIAKITENKTQRENSIRKGNLVFLDSDLRLNKHIFKITKAFPRPKQKKVASLSKTNRNNSSKYQSRPIQTLNDYKRMSFATAVNYVSSRSGVDQIGEKTAVNSQLAANLFGSFKFADETNFLTKVEYKLPTNDSSKNRKNSSNLYTGAIQIGFETKMSLSIIQSWGMGLNYQFNKQTSSSMDREDSEVQFIAASYQINFKKLGSLQTGISYDSMFYDLTDSDQKITLASYSNISLQGVYSVSSARLLDFDIIGKLSYQKSSYSFDSNTIQSASPATEVGLRLWLL